MEAKQLVRLPAYRSLRPVRLPRGRRLHQRRRRQRVEVFLVAHWRKGLVGSWSDSFKVKFLEVLRLSTRLSWLLEAMPPFWARASDSYWAGFTRFPAP